MRALDLESLRPLGHEAPRPWDPEAFGPLCSSFSAAVAIASLQLRVAWLVCKYITQKYLAGQEFESEDNVNLIHSLANPQKLRHYPQTLRYPIVGRQ